MLQPTRVEKLSNIYSRWLPIALTICAIGYYFWFLKQYALNIPFHDEIYDVLGFLSEVVEADGGQSFLQIFFVKWNEHSTAASHLLYYVTYRVQGELSFITLVYLANISLLVFFALLYIRLRHNRYRWLILLPVVFTLFHIRAYETILWGMTAVSYFYVLVYGFCCLYCLHQVNHQRMLLAIFFAALATFTLASGQLIWLVGGLGLVQQVFISKKISWVHLLSWLLAAAAVLLIWHSDSVGHPDLRFDNMLNLTSSEAHARGEAMAKAFEKPFFSALMIQFQVFLALLGSVVTGDNLLSATITGTVALVALVYFVVVSYRDVDVRLELCGIYIVLTVAAISYGRTEIFNLGPLSSFILPGNSRYFIPSTMLICILWTRLLVANRVRSVPVLYLVIFLTGFHCVNAYSINSESVKTYHDRRVKTYNNNVYHLMGVKRKKSAQVVARAVELGIYREPSRPLPMVGSGVFQQKKSSSKALKN